MMVSGGALPASAVATAYHFSALPVLREYSVPSAIGDNSTTGLWRSAPAFIVRSGKCIPI